MFALVETFQLSHLKRFIRCIFRTVWEACFSFSGIETLILVLFRRCLFNQLFFLFSCYISRFLFQVVNRVKLVSITGWAKENTHKAETFLLFGKIVKKLIITSISIINSIITQ